jgi:hypothetical protein
LAAVIGVVVVKSPFATKLKSARADGVSPMEIPPNNAVASNALLIFFI